MPGEGERWTIYEQGGDVSADPLPGWQRVEVVPASRLEAAESELREVRAALDRAQSEERGQRFARYAVESERDGMKILAGRVNEDRARILSALTEALDAMEGLIAVVEDYSNDDVRDYLRTVQARIRSQIEGSKLPPAPGPERLDKLPFDVLGNRIEGSNDGD